MEHAGISNWMEYAGISKFLIPGHFSRMSNSNEHELYSAYQC